MSESRDDRWADPDAERTQVLPTHQPGFDEPESDRTRVLPTAQPGYDEPESHRTRVLPTASMPSAAEAARTPVAEPTRGPADVPAPRGETDDPRSTDAWALAMARQLNRPSTDLGLVLLRLASLPLVLHGLHHLFGFGTLVNALRAQPVTAVAPEVIAIGVVVAQLLLPVLLAVGFLTRMAGLAQAALMASFYAVLLLPTVAVIDPVTGGLSGEATLAYAALALPLVFTGAGRFSLDHAVSGTRRERLADRRLARRRRA